MSVWSALKRTGSRARSAAARRRPNPAPVAGATPAERAARLEQKLQEYVDTLGPEHHRTIAARNNLAAKYAQSGRREAALTQFRSALADSVRVLGEEDPQTEVIRENLAATLEDSRRFEEAADHWEVLLHQRSRRLGSTNTETVNTRAGLAASYRRSGRLDAATAHFERAIDDSVEAGSEQVEALRIGLALVHRDARRFEATARQLRMVLAMRRRRLGPQQHETLTVQLHLGRVQLVAGREEEAAQTLERAYREALAAAGDPEVRRLLMRIRRDLARALRASGRIREAAALH